ncbi:MAG: winged helix-turn-helix domain-containing protein [Tagaea sp.]|nr:winged helix-turn-helix domain-containing protein [Tagaea sp.]
MTAPRLLLLALEPSARVLGEGLRAHGFRVETTQAADAALALAEGLGFDAAILDRDALPGRALGALVAKLGAPVCLLGFAGRKPPSGVAAALAKPVRLDDLAGLMRGLARPAAAERFGPYDLSLALRLLVERKTGREIRLTELEVALVDTLLKADGKAVSREALLRAIWGYRPGLTTRTLETHIYRLRRKIEREPARARLLITTRNGYVLSATRSGARAR